MLKVLISLVSGSIARVETKFGFSFLISKIISSCGQLYIGSLVYFFKMDLFLGNIRDKDIDIRIIIFLFFLEKILVLLESKNVAA